MTFQKNVLMIAVAILIISVSIIGFMLWKAKGNVTFQVPRAGKIVKSYTKITLGVSKGLPPDYYIIPDVINLSYDAAKSKIMNTGLRIGTITYEYHPELLKNTVLDQNMTSGMRVSFPASINLIISLFLFNAYFFIV